MHHAFSCRCAFFYFIICIAKSRESFYELDKLHDVDISCCDFIHLPEAAIRSICIFLTAATKEKIRWPDVCHFRPRRVSQIPRSRIKSSDGTKHFSESMHSTTYPWGLNLLRSPPPTYLHCYAEVSLKARLESLFSARGRYFFLSNLRA